MGPGVLPHLVHGVRFWYHSEGSIIEMHTSYAGERERERERELLQLLDV